MKSPIFNYCFGHELDKKNRSIDTFQGSISEDCLRKNAKNINKAIIIMLMDYLMDFGILSVNIGWPRKDLKKNGLVTSINGYEIIQTLRIYVRENHLAG